MTYETRTCPLDGATRLFLFSDGVFEIGRPDGSMLETEAFQHALCSPHVTHSLDSLLAFVREVHGEEVLEDDFSIVKLDLAAP